MGVARARSGARVRALLCVLAIAVGFAALGWSLTLPWLLEDFRLGVGVRLVMALAGATILVLWARNPRITPVTLAVGALGVFVLAYPTLLSVWAAFPDDVIASSAGSLGHVPPLLLIQFIPIIASTAVAGRRHHRWEWAFLFAAGVMLGCSVVGALPGAEVVGAVGGILWFALLAIAPIATWSAVRGVSGSQRRRAVLAALASIVPVVLITWCVALGAIGELYGLGADWSVSTLMIGFSVSTVLGSLLVLGTTLPADAWLLRSTTLVGLLDGLLALLALLAGFAAALISSATEVPTGWSVAIGAAVAVAAALGWLRLRGWTRRLVDPAEALRHELEMAAELGQGMQRPAALRALRRIADDDEMTLAFRVEGGWVDQDGIGEQGWDAAAGSGMVVARRGDGTPSVVALASTPDSARRIATLGECSALLQPALLEAADAHTVQRADLAAEAERRRLSQALHDGLQGRLLGLALNLQLSGRELDDPSARLLLDDTVATLRSMVEDVRALGGGRLPEILATDGLEPALRSLLAPVVSMVDLEIPDGRLPATTEATAYFVIGEAVTNALKHASAQRIVVRVTEPAGGSVRVTVQDDGTGGADPRMGSGLRGLAERVAAAGGALVVQDAPTGGTLVETVLPCGS